MNITNRVFFLKKKLLVVVITLITTSLFSQNQDYKSAFETFKMEYNAEEYEKIFESFSPEMKSVLPLENSKQLFLSLKHQVGKIRSGISIKDEPQKGMLFKTEFTKSTLAIYFTLNEENKISGLLIEPYEEPKKKQEDIINNLDKYPENFSNIIFSKAKYLPEGAQLSVALVNGKDVNYFGVIKQDSTLNPIENQDLIFEIGSITKIFTSTVLASLVVAGKLKLSDHINDYYPYDFKDNVKVSFESLANHTSGLPRLPSNLDLSDVENTYKNYSQSKIDDYLMNKISLKNNSYGYSNLGVGLLGHTLAKVEKTDYIGLLKKNVLDKYNMNNTFSSNKNLNKRLAKGIDQNGNEVSNWDFDVLVGCGGLLSSISDLVKFTQAHFKNDDILKLTRTETANAGENLTIGLGWHILKSSQGEDIYWHNGGTGGYSSSMIINPENKSAVIILANVGDINDMVDELSLKILAKK